MEIKDITGRRITVGSHVICATTGTKSFPALRVGRVNEIDQKENRLRIYMMSINNSVWVGNTKDRFWLLDPPKYAVSHNWEHTWSNGEQSVTRWVYDLELKNLVFVQMSVKNKWQPLNSIALADLQQDIEDNVDIGKISFAIEIEGADTHLSDTLPDWSVEMLRDTKPMMVKEKAGAKQS